RLLPGGRKERLDRGHVTPEADRVDDRVRGHEEVRDRSQTKNPLHVSHRVASGVLNLFSEGGQAPVEGRSTRHRIIAHPSEARGEHRGVAGRMTLSQRATWTGRVVQLLALVLLATLVLREAGILQRNLLRLASRQN